MFLRFAPGQLPPIDAFWSLTMYDQPASLLVANPIDRYLLNSTMLPQFKRDADGGLTLLMQNASPGKDLESKLAGRTEGSVLGDHAPVLAAGRCTDRQVDGTAVDKG